MKIKDLFFDKDLLWASLAIILIYPLFYIIQFKVPIDMNRFLLLVPFSYLSCLIMSVPIKILTKREKDE